ncbi:structural protein P5 [Pseudomonas nitroreducens]|uniref:structural protein n=1 Tax=Pseudomonas TaxID=286 RepID=UPI000315F66C
MAITSTRGIRNNNPGNIDYSPRNGWQGQVGLEVGVLKPRFARFDSPENGIRALGKLLIGYRLRDGVPGVGGAGIDTVREAIGRWAPGSENDTAAYIEDVARALGVRPDQPVDMGRPDILRALVVAIIHHENGGVPYTAAVIDEGVRRALA